MNYTEQTPRPQPEDGTNEDLNLTNADASLVNNSRMQPDASSMSDRAENINDENLTQSASQDGEIAPEYGDAADPTFEAL